MAQWHHEWNKQTRSLSLSLSLSLTHTHTHTHSLSLSIYIYIYIYIYTLMFVLSGACIYFDDGSNSTSIKLSYARIWNTRCLHPLISIIISDLIELVPSYPLPSGPIFNIANHRLDPWPGPLAGPRLAGSALARRRAPTEESLPGSWPSGADDHRILAIFPGIDFSR